MGRHGLSRVARAQVVCEPCSSDNVNRLHCDFILIYVILAVW